MLRNVRRTITTVGLAIGLMVLSACGDGPGSGAEGDTDPGVVATTPIWADVTSNVLCGEVEVTSIVPVGADSHSFEPSVQDADALRSVELVVANGLGLEEGLGATLRSAEESGATVLELAPSLEPLDGHEDDHGPDHEHAAHEHEADEHASGEHDAGEHEAGEHAAGEHEAGHHHDVDPHVWMDPDRVAAAVPLIVDGLAGIDDLPVDAARIDECAAAYVEELRALSAEMDSMLATVPDGARRLVTNHESLGYFADRFGFEIIGAVVPSTSSLGEASARDLDDLAVTMRDADVTAIFAETTGSTEVSVGLAERLGDQVSVVELHTESTGDAGGDAATYVDMMRRNAELIAEHVGGSAPR